MGSCNLGDHIVSNHIYTGITTCNIEARKHKYRLGTVSPKMSFFKFICVGLGTKVQEQQTKILTLLKGTINCFHGLKLKYFYGSF